MSMWMAILSEDSRIPQKWAPAASAEEKGSEQSGQKNRAKAMSMTRGFVVFLTVVLIAILFSCVNYLHTKSQITAQMKSVAALESELTQLKEENDAITVR